MKLNVYAIHDSAVGAYNNPMFFNTDGEAIRIFQNEANREDSMISQHPEQFTLFRIGTFDTNTAMIEIEPKKSLAVALDMKLSPTLTFTESQANSIITNYEEILKILKERENYQQTPTVDLDEVN